MYRLIASNAGGDSPASGLASATTLAIPQAPAAPSSLVATASSAKQVKLSWIDNSLSENGFRIERSTNGGKSWTQVAQVGANSTSFVDSTVIGRKTYTYRVRAFNDGGVSAYSNVATTTTPKAAPLPVFAPSDLAISGVSKSGVGLSWHDNSDNENGFRVERSTNGGKSWTQIASLSANSTSFLDKGVGHGKTYSYRVRGFGDTGNSGYTNVAQTLSAAAVTTSFGDATFVRSLGR
jgi:fibronectin type 3 domain-containing protein